MAIDNEDDNPGDIEVALIPRETLEIFEAFLENAELLSSVSRQRHDEVEESGRTLAAVDRLASIKALEGTLFLIDALFPRQSALKRPLIRIYDALVGVHAGLATDPLIQVDRPQQRPPHGAATQRLKGEAAAALTLYCRSGQTLEIASETVARHIKARDLSAIGYRLTPHKDIKGRTIMDWRSEVNQPRAQSVAAQRYNTVLDYFKKCGANEAASAAEYVLAKLLTAPKKIGKAPE